MAVKSTSYNPETHGRGIVIMPEGVHQFRIERATTNYKGRSPQWEFDLQPIEAQYNLPNERPYKCWSPEDGVVEALFDAAGKNPAEVQDGVDYQPRQFEGKLVFCEVFHKKVASRDGGEDMTFANIRRLHPNFSMTANEGEAASKYAEPVADTSGVPF